MSSHVGKDINSSVRNELSEDGAVAEDAEIYSGIGDDFQYDSYDSSDEDYDGDHIAKKRPTIYVGQKFDDKSKLQMQLHMLKLKGNFEFRVEKSDRTLLVVRCSHDSTCDWMVRASRINPESGCFTVRKYIAAHTCPMESRKCGKVPAKVMSQILIDDRGVAAQNGNPKDLRTMMLSKYGVDMNYWISWKSVQHVKDLVRGTAECGYSRLPSYIHLIQTYNPGTVAHLETDDVDRFKYLFISYGACVKGFRFLRKVIVVDGCFLKGKYKGLLLVATAQDGNYNLFPIAFGIVDAENDKAWEWFFSRLCEVIPDSNDLVLISDRHPSIAKAIANVYPAAHRAVCTYHLQKNIINKFRGGPVLGLVKKAAKAYTLREFAGLFDEIRRLNPRLHTYLEESGLALWSRAHFPGNRYNIMTSNIAESLNSALSKARELPIVTLLEYVGEMLSRWFCERRTRAALSESEITPHVEKLLNKRAKDGEKLVVVPITATRFKVKVTTGDFVVDFEEMKCSCRRFNVHKIPCVHALAAAKNTTLTWKDLVSRHYTQIYWYGAYSKSISPIEEWLPPPKIEEQKCLPPVVKKPPGRPKKKRFVAALEKAVQVKRPRKNYSCSKCGGDGHNRKTCGKGGI